MSNANPQTNYEKIWINSADDHLTEPADIWVQAGLSERSMKLAPYSKIENDREVFYCEGKEIFRVPMAMSEALHPPGADDLRLRMNDLDKVTCPGIFGPFKT
jgi:hypothetical protein